MSQKQLVLEAQIVNFAVIFICCLVFPVIIVTPTLNIYNDFFRDNLFVLFAPLLLNFISHSWEISHSKIPILIRGIKFYCGFVLLGFLSLVLVLFVTPLSQLFVEKRNLLFNLGTVLVYLIGVLWVLSLCLHVFGKNTLMMSFLFAGIEITLCTLMFEMLISPLLPLWKNYARILSNCSYLFHHMYVGVFMMAATFLLRKWKQRVGGSAVSLRK